MANAVEEHFLAVVRPAFPRHADFHIRGESGDICTTLIIKTKKAQTSDY